MVSCNTGSLIDTCDRRIWGGRADKASHLLQEADVGIYIMPNPSPGFEVLYKSLDAESFKRKF